MCADSRRLVMNRREEHITKWQKKAVVCAYTIAPSHRRKRATGASFVPVRRETAVKMTTSPDAMKAPDK